MAARTCSYEITRTVMRARKTKSIGPPHPWRAYPHGRVPQARGDLYTAYFLPFRYINCMWYSVVKMRIGKNTCQWLTLSSTDRCSERCMGEYCGVHLNRIRKGGGTNPCIKCGKGVYNRYSLCRDCGYANEKSNDWHRKERTLKKEFKRLTATLQISC